MTGCRVYACRLTRAAAGGDSCLSFAPTLTIESITGTSSRPNADSEYSVDGGEDGTTSRITTPFASSVRSRAASIFGEIPGMAFSSSPNRRRLPESFQITLVVQAPPSTAMQAAIGQPGDGCTGPLLRILSAISLLRAGYGERSGSYYLPQGMYYTKVSMVDSFPAPPADEEIAMKLYYSPGACSLSPHIVAAEAGIPLQLVKVDTKTKTISSEGDYWAINPKGYVPALELDDGQVLTEGPAIVQYLADLNPAARLAPANGTLPRYRLQEALNYITAEIHKSYSPLFNPQVPPVVREERIAYLRKRYALLDKQLAGRKYLFGDQFTVADAYLFVVTRWAAAIKLDLSDYANVASFQQLVAARSAVQAALQAEGVVKESNAGSKAKVA